MSHTPWLDISQLNRSLLTIDQVKHNPNFLANIPRSLGYVRRNLEKYPELQPLRIHLAPYVPEWQ